jgi:serine/threonine protein kinase
MNSPQPGRNPAARPAKPDVTGAGAQDTAAGGVPRAGEPGAIDFLAPPQQPGELGRLGPYRILQVLGKGGMGVVFKAEDPRLKRLCALKTMLPEVAQKPAMKERFLREALAAAQLEHDHIIPIWQVDEDRGVPYIAMPFLKGASLEDWFKQKQKGQPGTPLTEPQILKLGREIAKGLAAAHEKGLIHRDIKPANIWLDATAGGRVKILDFGLARLSEGAGEQHLTQSGAIMGTPAYMAPEQAQGLKIDGRADLFSLGVVLYRLCTGELPFKGDNPMNVLMSLATHEPPAVRQVNPAISPALSELVTQLLVKDPASRVGSAKEVVQRLQAMERNFASAGRPSVAAGSEARVDGPRSPGDDNPWRDLAHPVAPTVGLSRRKSEPEPSRSEQATRSLPGGHGRSRAKGLVIGGAAVLLVGLLLGGWLIIRDKDGKGEARGKVSDGGNGEPRTEVKATKGNGTAIVPAPVRSNGYALQFEKFGERVLLPAGLKLDQATSCTFEAFVTPSQESFKQFAHIVFLDNEGVLQITSNKWMFGVVTEKHKQGQTVSADLLARNRRIHVAGVRAPEELRLYLDGKLVNITKIVGGGSLVPRRDLPATIGGGTGPGGFFTGQISEVRISTSARYQGDFTPTRRFEPDAQTLALYHCDEGHGDVLVDSSGNGQHGKIMGAKWVKVDGSPIRPATPPTANSNGPGSVPLFNGRDLTGWQVLGHAGWSVKDGILVGETARPVGWLMSEKEYADFELSLEYRQSAGGNSGIFLRAWPDGPIGGNQFMEIQLIDDQRTGDPKTRTGAIFEVLAPDPPPRATVDEWHRIDIHLLGRELQVTFDDQKIISTNLDNHKDRFARFPGLNKTAGRIGLQLYPGKIEFRNIQVRELAKQ